MQPHPTQRTRRLVWCSLGLGAWLLLAGCTSRETPRHPVPDVQAAQNAALRPVALPVLDDLQASVRSQIQDQYARLRALEDGPESDRAGLGEAYGLMGQLLLAYDLDEPAKSALYNARQLLPEDARWPYYLGHLFQRNNDPEAARGPYEEALALRPDDVPTRVHLAEVYRDLERDEDAATLLEETLRLDPRCAAAHFLLGQIAGPTARAIPHYEAVLRLQPNASIVHYPLGLAYRNQGNLERSRDLLARRGDDKVNLPDPLLNQLNALKQGSDALLVRGSRLMEQRRYEEAAATFQQVVDEDPNSVDGYLNLGAALAQTGRADEAIDALEQTLRLDPSNSKAHFNLGVLYGGHGDEARALERFRAAVEADPSHSAARYALSKVLWRQRRCREALPHFASFLAAAPANVEARINQAICHAALGEDAEARALLEAGLDAAPRHPGLQDALIRILAASDDERTRDGQRALEMAERLVTTLRRAETLESLAMAYAEQGRFSEAVQAQQSAIQAARQQGLTDWLDHLDANLRRYRQEQPCRTPWEDVVFEK